MGTITIKSNHGQASKVYSVNPDGSHQKLQVDSMAFGGLALKERSRGRHCDYAILKAGDEVTISGDNCWDNSKIIISDRFFGKDAPAPGLYDKGDLGEKE